MSEQRPYVIKRDGTFVARADGQILGRVWLGDNGWYAENPHNRFGPNWTRWTVAREAWEDWQRIINTPTLAQLRIAAARRERLGDHVLDNLEGRAVMDLEEREHITSRVPARMLLSLITELRERRGAS